VPEVDVVLDSCVAGLGVERVGPCLAVAAREAERAGPADHGHLPDGHGRLVGPDDGDAAAVVGAAVLEHEGHGHEQRQAVLPGADVHALRAPHDLARRRRQVGPLGERVVHDVDRAEARGGGVGRRGLRHPRHRRARPAHHVVPVEPQVRLLLRRRRRRRE